MKDLIALRTPHDVVDFVRSLWRSELVQRSKYVDEWVQRMSRFPAVFAEMSDIDLEYPHFATWFGMTYRRSYLDPVISDLYYLHEIVYSSLLTYRPGLPFTAWYRKMAAIELSASLETECHVYLGIPGLREISFKDEIWADRFLAGPSRLGSTLRDVVRQERYKAMQNPDPMDYSEQQIAAYARQTFEWANGWKLDVMPGLPAYQAVEEHMDAFRSGTVSIEEHIEWLAQFGEIPFPTQARLFAPIYWRNKLSVTLKDG